MERLCKALQGAKRELGRACVWPLECDIKGLGVFGDQASFLKGFGACCLGVGAVGVEGMDGGIGGPKSTCPPGVRKPNLFLEN